MRLKDSSNNLVAGSYRMNFSGKDSGAAWFELYHDITITYTMTLQLLAWENFLPWGDNNWVDPTKSRRGRRSAL